MTELHTDKISILHRDLKPKNILVYNETKQPLISDFGSVKQFDIAVGCVSGSKTTLVYTPRESFIDNKYTKQSDIYQVGVSMFQILGGYFPGAYYDWLNEKEKKKFLTVVGGYEQSIFLEKVIQRLVTKNMLLNLESIPKYIDKKIVKVIQRATNPKLNVRYANTGEFMNDLFKIQKRLTNWSESDDIFYATKFNGDEYRVVENKKGFFIEKKGGDWRRKVGFSDSIEPLFEQLNRN